MAYTEDGPMTQAQARASVKRAREGLSWILDALKVEDRVDLNEACIEVIGAIAQIQDAIDDEPGHGAGVVGVWVPEGES